MPKGEKYNYLKNKHLVRRCFTYFLPYKFKIFISFISMGVVAAATGATAYLIQPAMDDIFINKDQEALMIVPIVFVVVMLVKGLFRFIQTYLMNTTGLLVLERLRNDLFGKIICLPMNFFEESQVGMLMSRILNDVTEIRQSLPSFIMMIREVFTIICLIGLVFYRDPYLASFAVLVLPLAIFPFFYFGRKLRKLGRKNQVKISDINAQLQEAFSGVKVIKAFSNEKREADKFEGENHRLVHIAIKQVLHGELSSRVMEVVGALGIGLVLWYGGAQVIQGNSTPGTFFSFIAALIMLYEPIKKINSANLTIQRAFAGAERVFEILDSPDIVVEKGGDVELDQSFKKLEIKDLTFSYPSSEYPVLDNINLDVKAGQKVAIVGPSGSGKTTLVNLIPRFYDCQQGKIILNGKPVEDYSLKSLRLNIGMVSQETFLFNATVRENISYVSQNAPMETVIESAQTAFAHEFIEKLPEGYDTVVGERGVRLSGGQKQRLTIARALLKNPPLLILDEATSALDTEAERIVQMALENLMEDRTSIVIAHRLSTVLSADVIVVMEKGKIVAKGRHKELLETSPLYLKLYNMQFQDNR
ncbi:ABC transporter ATP-binding protein [Maridesulfovibrio hydrothermalis]|uniref:Lipid A export ATP-binding/permease protein MsbA n=1 Tax=Maridesulfovibrio hydrothermalis AM13 = DSM 14728 TaxID=1121451 RepID=L0RCZ9_9BACT|nr:ABC transporter transmembrane domain-containing protein [Maridesulfovibrio hydrothermalis]CCO24634.1 Lipid A export ATP-binding/permease protein MsbA [Maridesulfovibrio hydrothermalis AM13 = DSM 14728]